MLNWISLRELSCVFLFSHIIVAKSDRLRFIFHMPKALKLRELVVFSAFTVCYFIERLRLVDYLKYVRIFFCHKKDTKANNSIRFEYYWFRDVHDIY